MIFGVKDKSVAASSSKPRMVCGIPVRKLSVRHYLEAMQTLGGGIVLDLLDAAFPGQKPGEILKSISVMEVSAFRETVANLLVVIPDTLIGILARLLEVPTDSILNLTPSELTKVLIVFRQVNDLSDFFQLAREVLPKMPTVQKIPGGSNG